MHNILKKPAKFLKIFVIYLRIVIAIFGKISYNGKTVSMEDCAPVAVSRPAYVDMLEDLRLPEGPRGRPLPLT